MKPRKAKPVTESMLIRSVASSSAIKTNEPVSAIERKLRGITMNRLTNKEYADIIRDLPNHLAVCGNGKGKPEGYMEGLEDGIDATLDALKHLADYIEEHGYE